MSSETQEDILEFVLDKQGYNSMMDAAIPQKGSKGVDAIKYHFEGMSQTANPALRNIAVPRSKLNEFNSIIKGVRKVSG